MIKGADISHQQGQVNFAKLRTDIAFIFCKASEGGSYHDPMFNTYWQALKQTNIIRGAYHFLQFGVSAEQQAENFLSRGVDFSASGCLPPVLDIEDAVGKDDADSLRLNKIIAANKPEWIKLAQDWLSIVEQKTGKIPIIYSYKNYFSEYLNNTDFSHYRLWLSALQGNTPGLPMHFTSFQFWQYSYYGSLYADRNEGVDLDYFNGTIGQLQQLANITNINS